MRSASGARDASRSSAAAPNRSWGIPPTLPTQRATLCCPIRPSGARSSPDLLQEGPRVDRHSRLRVDVIPTGAVHGDGLAVLVTDLQVAIARGGDTARAPVWEIVANLVRVTLRRILVRRRSRTARRCWMEVDPLL